VSASPNYNRPVVIWLFAGILMLILQILLGGITRLTGSGLSITEWAPLLGAIPPLNKTAWQKNFELYQHIAQFKKLNSSFTLSDYKVIFFWEWFHREWARLIGLVFLIPFVFFIYKGRLSRAHFVPLSVLFFFGILQGAIGWIMVSSGLNDTDVRVSHIRLAVHFLFALFLLCYLFWYFLKMRLPSRLTNNLPRLKRINGFLLLLVFLQLIYGAFMAGSHAALYATSWPDINGQWVPSTLLKEKPLAYRLCYDPLLIQFVHRTLAYIITIVIVYWFIISKELTCKTFFYSWRMLPIFLVLLQVILGVWALTHSPQHSVLGVAVAHQCVGMLLLLSLVFTLYLSESRKQLF
jgi:cytochrome c oxidase assembly protein subunit 15